MANVYRNISRRGWNGAWDRQSVYCRTRSGKTIVPRRSLREDHQDHTKTNKTHPEAVRAALAYADFAMTQDVYLRRELDTGLSAYCFALADWFGAPRILEIDVDSWTGRPGQCIRVKARDNILVAAVSVMVRSASGDLLEAGEAVPERAGSSWWKYITRACVSLEPFPSVEATARDLPGNRDSFVIN